VRDHDSKCVYQQLNCKGCKGIFFLKDIQAHKDECSMFSEICGKCQNFCTRKDLLYHSSQCEDTYTNCKNEDCKVSIRKGEMKDHEAQCGFMDITCKECECSYKKKDLHNCILHLKAVINSQQSMFSQELVQIKNEILALKEESNQLKTLLYKKCNTCNMQFCEGHLQKCAECNDLSCKEDFKKCQYCKNVFCSKDKEKCICSVCNGCSTCRGLVNKCQKCSRPYCKSHKSTYYDIYCRPCDDSV